MKILDYIAPNYCYSCQKIGESLCNNCKKRNKFNLKIIENAENSLISRELYLSRRDGFLQEIVDDFKFNNKKENAKIIAEIIKMSFSESQLDLKNCVFVPIPTAKNRIRTRGFDHIKVILDSLSDEITIGQTQFLKRLTNTQQRGKNAEIRRLQAQKAFKINGRIDPAKTYIIFDDIKTTGATIDSAAEILKAAGAQKIYSFYILKQINY